MYYICGYGKLWFHQDDKLFNITEGGYITVNQFVVEIWIERNKLRHLTDTEKAELL